MFKKLLLNELGNISWMKLGGLIVTVSGLVVAGVIPGLPLGVIAGAKVTLAIGSALGIAGARDAIGAQKNTNTTVLPTSTIQTLTEEKK